MSKFGWAAKMRATQAAKPNKGKVDNNAKAIADKVELRRRVLAEIAGPVFDAFAGGGEMFRRIWHQAPGYVGCDLRWFRDDRRVFVADNRRVMRAIDLGPYQIFDFDSWGSPWEAAEIMAHRRKIKTGERLGLCLTEGAALRLAMGAAPTALARLAGIDAKAAGLMQSREEIIARAIKGLCRLMNCKVLKAWQSHGRTASRMSYIALIVEGLPVPESVVVEPGKRRAPSDSKVSHTPAPVHRSMNQQPTQTSILTLAM